MQGCNVSGPTKFQTTTSTCRVSNLSTGTRHRPSVQTCRKLRKYWTYSKRYDSLCIFHKWLLVMNTLRPQRQHVHCPLSLDCCNHRCVKCATWAHWITSVRLGRLRLCFQSWPMPCECLEFLWCVSIPRCRRCHQLQCLLPLRRLPPGTPRRETVLWDEVRQRDSAPCQIIRNSCMIHDVWCRETWNEFDMFRFRLHQLLQSSGKFRPCGRSQCQPVKTDSGMTELRRSDQKSVQDFSTDCCNGLTFLIMYILTYSRPQHELAISVSELIRASHTKGHSVSFHSF